MTTPIECPECEGEGCETCDGQGLLVMPDEDAELIDRLLFGGDNQ